MNEQATIKSIEQRHTVLLSSHVLLIMIIFFSLSTRQSMPGVSPESLIDLYVIIPSFSLDDVLNLSTSSVDCLLSLSLSLCFLQLLFALACSFVSSLLLTLRSKL